MLVDTVPGVSVAPNSTVGNGHGNGPDTQPSDVIEPLPEPTSNCI